MAFQEDFYKTLLDNLYDGVYFVDANHMITYWNKASENITGFASEQIIGRSCQDNILNHCNEAGMELCKNGCPLTKTIQTGTPHVADIYLHHAQGHRIPVRIRVSPIIDESGNIVGAVVAFSNNTDLFKARYRIRNLEQTITLDPLTRIGNRRYGEVRLKSALLEFQETNNPFGLLFIDIDNFKHINDTYGHEVGDRVLQLVVANTMRANLEEMDAIVRWGGEEFVILIDVPALTLLKEISERLRSLVARSRLQLPDEEIGVTISIGATLVQTGDTLETIVTRADHLMYKSKRAGKNQVMLG